MRKVLERAIQDEERMGKLEEELNEARYQTGDAFKKHEEGQVESELGNAEERDKTEEMIIIELEEKLIVVITEKLATRSRSKLQNRNKRGLELSQIFKNYRKRFSYLKL